jgi:hypothetical protein
MLMSWLDFCIFMQEPLVKVLLIVFAEFLCKREPLSSLRSVLLSDSI